MKRKNNNMIVTNPEADDLDECQVVFEDSVDLVIKDDLK